MATRRETNQRRRDLYENLRNACDDGTLKQGELLPSVRELSQQYKVSVNIVCDTLAVLVEEGLLTTVPRVGTFLGRANSLTSAPYLMVRPESPAGSYFSLAQSGFETRIGQLGGSSLCLTSEAYFEHLETNDLPILAGIFDFQGITDASSLSSDAPIVGFGADKEGEIVDFDNVGGGSQATQHLLQAGHRNIAFLGLHGHQGNVSPFLWSAQRAEGWKKVMSEAGFNTDELLFQPKHSPPSGWHEQADAAQSVSGDIIKNRAITAIVAANSFVARGVLKALQQSNIPAEKWPAIMCFDTPEAGVSVVSCVQQPWDEIGREAAQTLWERHNGRLTGDARQRLVAMRLVPRLTSRADWAVSNLARNHAIDFVQPLEQNHPTFESTGIKTPVVS